MSAICGEVKLVFHLKQLSLKLQRFIEANIPELTGKIKISSGAVIVTGRAAAGERRRSMST
jgi:hypothetical protein